MTWMAAGAGLSTIGSLMGGAAQNRARRQARDWTADRTDEGYQRLLNLLYGPNAGGQSFSKPGGAAPTASSGSLLGRLGGIRDFGFQQGQDITRGYDAGTNRLMGLAGGAEGMARDWGVGREKIIRDDADRGLTALNRQGDAVLAAGGFNAPTVRANQRAGNAATIGRETNRALQDHSEAQVDRQMGARTQTLNVAGGREGGRTGLMTNLLSQNLALQRAPIDVEMQAAQSSIANPWLNHNTSAYYPGASGLGSAMSNLGGAATAYGSYQLGQQNQEEMLKRLLAQK